MTVFHILIYLSLLILLAGVIARAVRIARMPVHLRWELYPVPHEKGRASYGGSIFEEVDWWTKPRKVDRLGELGVMIPEILFLKGVWEHNRSLWLGSFTLHFGLYLLMGELALLLLSGVLTLTGIAPGLLNAALFLVPILALAGCIIGLFGAVVMFFKRITDPRLRPYTNSSHYFNLLLLCAIYLTGLLWVLLDPEYTANLAGFFAGWMSLSSIPALPGIGYWHVGLVLFFLAYFPFTHMTHAFVKYFTYHDVRWEDAPNVPGGRVSRRVERLVRQPVTWAAPHVNADGKKTWAEIALETGETKLEPRDKKE